MSAQSSEQARRDLESLYYSAIKARSNLLEAFSGSDGLHAPPSSLSMAVLAQLQPWLFDPDKDVILRLEVYTDASRHVEPMEYWNWMHLIFRFAPVVTIGCGFYGSGDVPTKIEDVRLYSTWPEED